MALNLESGRDVRVTISKNITRDSARKTLARIFAKDKALTAPLEARAANFIPLPRRRGGRIWTKHANKLHLALTIGTAANVRVTPQVIRDLNSVSAFVSVA